LPGTNSQLISFNLKVFMPFWNRSLKPPGVDYTEIDTGVWYDPINGWSNASEVVAQFCWLNKLNPDWKNLVGNTPTPYHTIRGENTLAVDSVASMTFNFKDAVPQLDKWWGSKKIARFGCCAPTKNGSVVMPLIFLNHLTSLAQFDDEGYDGVYYNLAPGVTAEGNTVQYGVPPDNVSKVPPVYWYCLVASQLNLNNLATGASPVSIQGPEILP